MLGWRIVRHAVAILATILLGGLLSATLVRLAPGFDADEQQLDPRLSAESVRTLRESRAQEQPAGIREAHPLGRRRAAHHQ